MKFYPNRVWKDEIMPFVEEIIRKNHVPKDKLMGDGAIYYSNGNDGTEFDWNANNHTCEFGLVWKETELYCLKFYICKSGSVEGFFYDTPDTWDGKRVNLGEIGEEDACNFARYMQKFFDDRDIYDEPIFKHTDFAPVEVSDIYNYEILTPEEEEEKEREEEEYERAWEEEYYGEDEDTMYGKRVRAIRKPKALHAHKRITPKFSPRNEVLHLRGKRVIRPHPKPVCKVVRKTSVRRVAPSTPVRRPTTRKRATPKQQNPFGLNIRRMF